MQWSAIKVASFDANNGIEQKKQPLPDITQPYNTYVRIYTKHKT